jgi:hypothetical protein
LTPASNRELAFDAAASARIPFERKQSSERIWQTSGASVDVKVEPMRPS